MTSADVQATRNGAVTSRTGFAPVLLAEWTKLSTLRSMYWILAASAAVSIGIGALLMVAHVGWGTSPQAHAVDPVPEVLTGLRFFGLLGFAVVGALAMTSEYSTGTIRATFAAVPRRLHVLAAKSVVVGLTTLVVATLASFALFFVLQPILAPESPDVSIRDSGVLFAMLGGGIYVAGAALAGLALGAIIRNTMGTLVAVISIFFLAGIITQVQPDSWSTVTKFLPHRVGLAMMSSIDQPDLLSPAAGLLVLAGWIAAAFVAAGFLLERRDTDT